MNLRGKFEKVKAKGIVSLMVFSMVSVTSLVHATSATWDGQAGNGGNLEDWAKKQNWGNVNPVPGVADIATFGNVAAGATLNPLVLSATSISNIVFTATTNNYTLGGTAVLTVGGSIVNNGTTLQTINTSLALARAQTWTANTGNLAFGGPINNSGFALTIGGAANTSVSGVVSGAGALNKTGNGTLTITSANTYSGVTTVSAGRVLVNNTTGSGTGTNTVTVNGGTFGGKGTITGGLTLNSGSRISAGDSAGASRVGTFTSGNQTWNGGAGMDWEIKDVSSGAGTGWDLLSMNGTLAINATSGNKFTIYISSLTLANTAGNVNNFNNAVGYTWTIASTTGGITGFDANAFDLNISGFSNPLNGSSQFFISLVDGGNGLAITYVPEPSTIALGLIGAAFIAGRCLRRSNKK